MILDLRFMMGEESIHLRNTGRYGARREQLVQEIVRLSWHYRECCAEAERYGEGKKVKKELEALCAEGKVWMNIAEPELLLALMDAYEVTRDEEMLQELLDVVSKDIGRLEVSGEAVKLLIYCYYYVEEEECVVKAREILEQLKREGKDTTEVEKVWEELIGF